MNKKLFITRSNHDIGNTYLSAYSQEIIEEAQLQGWRVEKAENENNEKKNVSSRLTNKPNLVVLNGHGSEEEVCGYQDKVILDSSNSKLLSETICFIRACSCMNGLGKDAVKKGAKAIVGYAGEFWIPRINEYEATPLKDPSAKQVLETSNLVALKLTKGATVREAVRASKEKARELMFEMITREEPYDSPALKALVNNNLLLAYQGDDETTV